MPFPRLVLGAKISLLAGIVFLLLGPLLSEELLRTSPNPNFLGISAGLILKCGAGLLFVAAV